MSGTFLVGEELFATTFQKVHLKLYIPLESPKHLKLNTLQIKGALLKYIDKKCFHRSS